MKKKILIVEDDQDFSALLKYTLGVSDVRLASSLSEAVKMILTAEPEAILLDLSLCDSDSCATLANIADLKVKARGAPVIVITGDPSQRAAALKAGADEFLWKDDGGFFAKLTGLIKPSNPNDPRPCAERNLVEKIERVVDDLAGLATPPRADPATLPPPPLMILGF